MARSKDSDTFNSESEFPIHMVKLDEDTIISVKARTAEEAINKAKDQAARA